MTIVWVHSLKNTLSLLIAIFVFGGMWGYAPNARAEMIPAELAHLGALEKTTGKFTTINIPVGQSKNFETVHILVRACYRSDPLSPKDSVAFIEVDETIENDRNIGFSGWIFASSPGISGLEHPLLDVWLIECQRRGSQTQNR